MLVVTETALYALAPGDDPSSPQRLLEDVDVRAVTEHGPWRIAALTGGALVAWEEGRESRWQPAVPEAITSCLVLDAGPLRLLLGTEPPHLYRVEGPGERAARVPSFDGLEVRSGWSTPWGGPPAVRRLARGGTHHVYADIHVGSIMRSADGGRHWEPVTPELDRDVHDLCTTPAAPGRLYADTADAVWVSPDHGTSWEHRPFPHEASYGRAIAAHPGDPDCLLATVSEGPHGEDVRGRLFRSDDAGRSWTHVTRGFPAYTEDNINTGRIGFDAAGTAWAAVGHTLYRSDDRGRTWTDAWRAPAVTRMIATGLTR